MRNGCLKKGKRVSIDVSGPRKHDEIPSILNEASALVLPSYWEGMPSVVLEAMASGVPVIATGVGDISRLIENERTGFLINRSFRSFKEAVDSVLSDEPLVREVTENARKAVEHGYSVSRVEQIVNSVYYELLS
jgi:glycosyltransferase involved in cell wall biosynthesis